MTMLNMQEMRLGLSFGVDVADISRTIRSILYEMELAPNYVAGGDK